jgi:arylformamidase
LSRTLDLSVLVNKSTSAPPAAGGAVVAIEHHRRGPGHWQASSMSALLHTGSHVDSAWHVFEDGEPIAATPLDRVVGEACLVDCSDVGPREAVDAARLQDRGGDVREGDIAVIRTDWTDRTWGDFPRFYLESPYLTEDAADWLVERGPKAVVFDFFEEYSAALDDFTSEDFVVHRRLLGENLPLVEQATNLGAVGSDRFTLLAPFYRLDEAEAAPCRIFALLD